MCSGRRCKYLLHKYARWLGRSAGTAHQIALGIAIGFFVGWMPIYGIQTVAAVAVCHCVGANKILAIPPSLLNNPITIIPIYSFNYWIGRTIVGGPPLTELVAALGKMLAPPDSTPETGWLEPWLEGIRYGFGELWSMGGEMLLPFCLGCGIVGGVLAVSSYYLTLHIVESFRQRRRSPYR